MWTAPDPTDPENGGSSLINAAEILLPCLDAVEARHVVEVGADGGDLTRLLLGRAKGVDGTVTAIDPAPRPGLLELAGRDSALRLLERPSHEVLGEVADADVVILDGDHNHHTVSEELRVLADGRDTDQLPLIVLHDIGWPHARRDTYYDPDRIPEMARQPYVRDAKLSPGEPGIAEGGLPFGCAAEREGGPRNGVLTAVEDFLDGREGLRFERVPIFWGVGFIWPSSASWSDRLATALAPWAGNPLLERIEEHRVAHLVELCAVQEGFADLRGVTADLLIRMLGSRAFGLAERISRLNQGGEPIFSRQEAEELLAIAEGRVDEEQEPAAAPARRRATADVASGASRASAPATSTAS